jgi:hypothetical protein
MQTVEDVESFLQKKDVVSKHVDNEKNKFDDLQKMLSRSEQIYSQVSRNIKGKGDGQILFLCDPVNVTDVMISVARKMIENNLTPVLILTTMNYKAAQKVLKKANIEDKVFLIDTVSKSISLVKNSERVLFVDSLRNLTQLQIKIIKFIKGKEKVVFFFDALNVLELYHSEPIILKFTYSISKLLKKYKTDSYYSITKKLMVPKLSQFFDGLVEIKKVE